MSIEEHLKNILGSLDSSNSEQDLAEITHIFKDVITGTISKQEAVSGLLKTSIARYYASLSGKKIQYQDSIIEFGNSGEFGDITFRDVANGNITRLNFPITIKQDSQNYTIGHQMNIYYINKDEISSISPAPSTEMVRGNHVEIVIETGSVLDFKADIMVLKFAEAFYGADESIASSIGLTESQLKQRVPELWDYTIVPNSAANATPYILFIRVGELWAFQYEQIRKFTFESLRTLSHIAPGVKHIAMTIHGVGYGLDEFESFRSQIAGFFDAFQASFYPPELERISIVELNSNRARRLHTILNLAVPKDLKNIKSFSGVKARPLWFSPDIRAAGDQTTKKPLIFVISPAHNDFDDVYYYGIQDPASKLGYICERSTHQEASKSDIDHSRSRISHADIVIAEISNESHRLHFEIGYALGHSKRVLLICKGSRANSEVFVNLEQIIYESIRDLERQLSRAIKSMLRQDN